MFRYFPKNYVWNLSVDLSIEMGARIGEIEEMCAPLLAASEHPDADGTRAFRDSWSKMADKLCRLAAEDEARGRLLSAGEKYLRAANYYLTCERLQAQGAEGRKALYKRFLDVFAAGLHHSRANCQRVEIPYGDKTLAGLYVRAEGVSGPAPLLLQVNGLDSTKEMKYLVGLPQWLAKRGVSSLVVDQPGTGEALRLHNMKARFDSEHWASRIVDWLEQQPDVDASRIGMEGVSLGGYYCPRAVAFEPRFACGVVWGANHDWRDVQKRRLEREGDFPVPHYWDHVRWVWGGEDIPAFMRIAEDVHLDGVLDRIRVPFLVTHGEKDSQIPLKWAHRTYEQLVNSPRRELKIFTDLEGGVQHSSFDNSINAGQYIADWVAETLGGRVA
ncbi:alpha/beta hydrolase [Pluralibacter gergoviae]|uniref:alpha/beta hydrolase family protein n=1 Tax=Pluralibacter gergoviae TaxID=61647 RepID=UPI0005EC4485|nr:prolyl oligopeptidase family serine peptidase [Pluralibacter gergoviae]EKV0932497.1 prolyl oligopeptidase family serine peptidase [Pluralibacter gergoviae]EKV6248108.1 prolyl oligopeptidase family serine peptidase [Pluralibacter gergoviae]EKW9967916.1 prolyl oligopeptidase family serine peptidase [Pluralibacter gergoviae]ELD4273760.1 prolyl oligopeptidase family serine peptidase [Pluralibacter gergoviae]ELD4279372.1 prolyl oligopeptidase family serine peptidase [Pluralibacter gergoviae]